MDFYKATGVRCKFIVFDNENKKILSQWLDILEAGEHFDTKHGIRIYPVENFDIENALDNSLNTCIIKTWKIKNTS